ncbi:MAG: hypothetical protein HY081_05005 [Gammaproteobacteria bacterium]|nr:hypothetical protein [Gammaproteobacteria bacterium]
MKKFLSATLGFTVLIMQAVNPTSADNNANTTESMSAEQKQAMRAQMQQKQAEWQTLSPEQKQAKRKTMRERMQAMRNMQGAASQRQPSNK